MFENLSYKKKFFALIALLVVLGITAYKRSFSMTIDAYKVLNSSKSTLAKVSNAQQRISTLKTEIAYLDKIIGKESANADLVQQEILHMFTSIDTEVKLVKLEEVHKAKNDYFNIFTNRLILSGRFNDLLAVSYEYEKKFEFSRIVSLRFYIEKERRTNRKKLFHQIIFQNYEKIL